jgi:hypothetical protein
VTKLHLRQFKESRESLSKALDMQRYNLRVKRLTCDREELKSCLLEVADTLVNLGGLGQEWVRHEGRNDYILSESEHHLAEALEIRCTVFVRNHPLVIQAKSLHEMVHAMSQFDSTADTPARMQNFNHNAMGKNLDIDTPHYDSSTHNALPTEANAAKVSIEIHQNCFNDFEEQSIESNFVDSQYRNIFSQQDKFSKKSTDFALEKLNISSSKNGSLNEKTRFYLPKDSETFGKELKQVRWQYLENASVHAKKVNLPDDSISSILTDEEDEILPANKNKHEKPEWNKVYVEPHHIPRCSPIKNTPIQEISANESDTEMAVNDNHHDIDQSIDSPFSDINYDSEESCLLNRSGILTDSPPAFMIHNKKENDTDHSANMSAHEILIVQPIHIPLKHSTVDLLENEKEANGSPLFPTFYGGQTYELEESEDGIAPLHRNGRNKDSIHLSPTLDETSRYDLSNMHASASRHLKVGNPVSETIIR